MLNLFCSIFARPGPGQSSMSLSSKRALFPWLLLFLGPELGGSAGLSFLWRQQSSSLLREVIISRRQAEPTNKFGTDYNLELYQATHRELRDCSWLARQDIAKKSGIRLRGGSSQYGTYNTPITFFSNNGHIAQVRCFSGRGLIQDLMCIHTKVVVV